MADRYTHPTDEELLSFVDGELSPGESPAIERHLATCWECRARRSKLENTIGEFLEAHHGVLDSQLPPAAGPRALLKARMAELRRTPRAGSWRLVAAQVFDSRQRIYALAALVILIVAVGAGYRVSTSTALDQHLAAAPQQVIPNARLTPGAVRPISVSEVCSVSFSDDADQVPTSLRRQVLQEYKVSARQAGNYELDYLVSPQLGGTEDIRNLWPEPKSTAWNLRAKDALEDHLHDLVCEGKLDLATAQRDLSSDWITAYQKYFHTLAPVTPS